MFRSFRILCFFVVQVRNVSWNVCPARMTEPRSMFQRTLIETSSNIQRIKETNIFEIEVQTKLKKQNGLTHNLTIQLFRLVFPIKKSKNECRSVLVCNFVGAASNTHRKYFYGQTVAFYFFVKCSSLSLTWINSARLRLPGYRSPR